MKLQYLEIVSQDVDTQCAHFQKIHNVEFSAPTQTMGNARIARLNDNSLIGIRAPMHETEEPVTRPYFLCTDIETAIANLPQSGVEIMHPPLEIPGYGTFAVYKIGGVQQGLWQI